MAIYSHFDKIEDAKEREAIVKKHLPNLDEDAMSFAILPTQEKLDEMRTLMDAGRIGTYFQRLDICMVLPTSQGGIPSSLIEKVFIR